MKHPVILLFALALASLLSGCDKTKDDVMPASFSKLVLQNDYFMVQPNSAITIDVMANDTIMGEAKLTMGTPAKGTLQPAATPGQFTYQPPTNFTGTDNFSYTVCIGQTCKSAEVTVVVGVPPCQLRARPDSVNTPYQQTVLIPILDNDQTCGPVTITLQPTKRGNASLAGDQIMFTPVPGTFGPVVLTYTLCSPIACDSATVTVNVEQPIMFPPSCGIVTRPDTINITSYGTGITSVYIPVLANDTYCQNLPLDELTVIFPGYSQYGWAEIDASTPANHIKYSTSFPGFYINYFTYRVCQTINNIPTCKYESVLVYINP